MPRRLSAFVFLLVACVASTRSGAAAQPLGKVTEVKGSAIVVSVASDAKPTVGDRIEILVEVPDVGEALVGTAQVTAVLDELVLAKIEKATGKVAKGQVARIASTARRPPRNEPDVPPAPAVEEDKLAEDPSSKPWLGVSRIAVDGNKVMLCWVLEDGPAGKAGLMPYDMLHTIAGQEVKNIGQFHAAIDARRPGDEIVVEYQRYGDVERATVGLEPLPADGGTSMFLRDAEAGHGLAQMEIGVRYGHFRGHTRSYCERDDSEAVRWFRTAADAGEPYGRSFLAIMYQRGRGVERNFAEAARLYESVLADELAEAVPGLQATAAISLGKLYEAGEGVSRNTRRAEELYVSAAERGSLIGTYVLGQLYEQQRKNKDALRYYHDAAKGGYPQAIYRMGEICLEGKLVRRSEKTAFNWFKKGAEQAGLHASHRLGRLYEQGIGTNRDRDQAIRWYRVAAARGHAESAKRLEQLGAALSVPATGQARSVSTWEEVDPKGDCTVQVTGSTISITVPGTFHDLAPFAGFNNMDAPRVLQPVEGDFVAEVRVRSFERPRPGTGVNPVKPLSFVSAGLLVWQDDRNFIRLQRAANGDSRFVGTYGQFIFDGETIGGALLERADESTYTRRAKEDAHLRFERKGSRVILSKSSDGVNWTTERQDLVLSPKLRVGVFVINVTNQQTTHTFTDFRLSSQ